MRRVETVIVGGGPAGAATACGLAGMGREAVVVERAAAPHHKVCGEFLSIETQTLLRQLGIDAAALGAVPIDHVAVYSSARSVTAALPFRALSLSRYRLDDALLCRAQECGAQVKRGVSVRNVTPDGEAWIVECDDGESLRCRHLVLATGKLGLRGIGDARDNSLVGLKMHLRPAAEIRRALTGCVELFLLNRGYVGLELVEDGIANLCCVLPRATVARLAPGWQALRDYLAAKLAQPRRAAGRRRPALGQGHGHRLSNRRPSAQRGRTRGLSCRRPARAYTSLHRRRDCDRARLGRARGRAYPARQFAGRLPHGRAALVRPHHPACECRFGPRRDRRRTQRSVRRRGNDAKADRNYRAAY